MQVPQETLKLEPYDSAEPLLRIGCEEAKSACQRHAGTPHASFTVAKIGSRLDAQQRVNGLKHWHTCTLEMRGVYAHGILPL